MRRYASVLLSVALAVVAVAVASVSDGQPARASSRTSITTGTLPPPPTTTTAAPATTSTTAAPATLLTATEIAYAPPADTTTGEKCKWLPYHYSGNDVCQELDIWYWSDHATRARPTVLFVHQGGWFSNQRWDWSGIAEGLARAGYVTATMSYDLQQGDRYLQQPKDVANAVRWLKANGTTFGIDPARIALYGASAGAHLSLLHGMREGRDGAVGVKAVVEYSGPSDLTMLATSTGCRATPCYADPVNHDEYWTSQGVIAGWATQGFASRKSERWSNGNVKHCLIDNSATPDHSACPENYSVTSPSTYVAADRKLPAMLLVHAPADPVVPFDQLQVFTAALDSAGYDEGVDFWTMYPPACHGNDPDGTKGCTKQEVLWTGNNPLGETKRAFQHAQKWLGRHL